MTKRLFDTLPNPKGVIISEMFCIRKVSNSSSRKLSQHRGLEGHVMHIVVGDPRLTRSWPLLRCPAAATLNAGVSKLSPKIFMFVDVKSVLFNLSHPFNFIVRRHHEPLNQELILLSSPRRELVPSDECLPWASPPGRFLRFP